ncbi:hypothetical protein WAX46_10395 [Bacillus sp. FJAT-53060]|uniref:hypothetical protein n=1 Tax=Bacillus TaxID=1386 RepID=UPI001CFBBC7E|nr:hypothetical protein [Bacillus stratosphericus]
MSIGGSIKVRAESPVAENVLFNEKDGLSRTFVMETKEAYDKANAFLAKSQPQITVMAKKKKNCGGVNRYDGNRVAGTVYIDSCRANKMAAIINAGGTGIKVKVLRNPINGKMYPYWIKPQ